MCCTVLRVDEIGKLAGSPCAKLAPGGGCGIHATRPGICRAYRCAWLEGKFREDDRPDRLGAVVDFAPRGASFDLVIIEGEPGCFDASVRLQEIADAHREAMPVRISDTTRIDDADRPFRVLLPAGEEQRVVGDRVTVLRDGVPIEERRLPWIERGVRRLFVALRRLRLRIARGRSF
jgi:hypothetical protein